MPRIKKPIDVAAQIERMVKRIVRKFHPEQIILFGSQARGDAGPDSDVDLLIVMPVEGSKRDKRLAIPGADASPRRPKAVAPSPTTADSSGEPPPWRVRPA